MSARARVWLWLAAWTVAAAASLVALAPAQPRARLPWPLAPPFGVACGVVLFLALARKRPRLWAMSGRQLAVLGVWAANEEVLWRRVALGELLPRGALPALVASTLGFALLHRRRPLLHLGTGGVFGLIYLGTGVVAASVGAHWTYNVLVGGAVRRPRR